MTPRGLLPLCLTLLAPLAAAAAAPPGPALPTRLACAPDDIHRVALSLDAQGAPLAVSVSVAAGARECDLASSGAAQPQPDGSWRFTRPGADGALRVTRSQGQYVLELQPPACGALQLPDRFTLSAQARGCSVTVDRQAAFVLFWRALREAIARDDGAALERLSLPRLSFVEGPDEVTAPASVMRHAARCVPDVPAPVQRTDMRSMLQATDEPRLDMPPLSLRQQREVSFAGAMTAVWTAQGWRIQGFNASPAVMRHCAAAR